MLRVGIIGAGYIADYHLEILSDIEYVNVAACCDVSMQRAESLKAKWNIPKAHDNIDEFLEQNSLDVVHILVPPDYHYSVAKKVIENKVSILLEKPMCETSRECQELIQLAKDNNVKIGVNQNSLFHPVFLNLQKDIQKGIIGKIHQVVSFQSGPLGQLDAGMFGHWMFNEPNNVLLEQAPHPVAQIRALMGDVQDIQATVYGKRELSPNQLFYDRWQAIAKCKKGSAIIHLSFGKQYYLQSWMEVSGEDGSIRVDLLKNLYLIQKKSVFPDYLDPFANAMKYARGVRQGFGNFADYVLSKLKLQGKSDLFYVGMKNSIESFYEALSRNNMPPVSGEDGKRVIEFCEKWAEAAGVNKNPKFEVKPFEDRIGNAKILITGATGFVGSHLVEYFIKKNIPVRVLVRNPKAFSPFFSSQLVEIVQGDILNAHKIEKAMQGVQYVFHLAHSIGQTWNDFKRINIVGTRTLAEASLKAKVKYFVFTSTIATYYTGDIKEKKIDEQMPIDPKPMLRNDYARSKIVLEHMLMEMYQNMKLPVIIFRPAIVIGKGGIPYHSGVGQWTRDNVCAYWGKGENDLPFVLAEDVASALGSVLEKNGLEGETFNLAGDIRFSARKYIQHLTKYSHRNICAFPYPTNLCFLSDIFKYLIKVATGEHKDALLSYRDLANRSILADYDNSRAKNLLKWQPCNDPDTFIEKGIGWAFEKK